MPPDNHAGEGLQRPSPDPTLARDLRFLYCLALTFSPGAPKMFQQHDAPVCRYTVYTKPG